MAGEFDHCGPALHYRLQSPRKRQEGAIRTAITANWRGTPLTTYETIVDRIGNVRTATGLRVRAELDAGEYPTDVTVTKEQMDALAFVRDEFHGEWNCKTVTPMKLITLYRFAVL